MNERNTEFGVQATRRDVLKASGALTVSFWLPQRARGEAAAQAAGVFEPNAFIRIDGEGVVTVFAKHLEMGQGVYTGLATIVAEELDGDWSKIRVEGAAANAQLYNNTMWGPVQGTGGSTSIANSYEQLRKAGATARAMLVGAAAKRWDASPSDIAVENGVVRHASGKSATFGELAADAARLPIPTNVTLKDPATFKKIGQNARRVDSLEKSTGKALYVPDLKLPGMLTAVVAHAPRFGGKVKGFDAAKAKAIKGVKAVVAFETPVRAGVAVLANDFWTARKGRDALVIDWDESNAFKRSSEDLFAEYRTLAKQPGASAKKVGDIDAALAKAARTLEATYEFPYLAHATLEPMNCVVRIGAQECEIWNGEQFQTGDQLAVAKALNLPPSNVRIHQLYAGGSFGRRANPKSDYLLEAVAIAKAAGVSEPVKLVWTREEDMRAGFYRPMFVHALTAGLDREGKLTAWRQRIVGQSIMAGTAFDRGDPIDRTSVEGAANLPYAVPNFAVELHSPRLPVPVQWWRSVGSTHTAFAVECFLDDVARETKQDPYVLRRALLEQHPRHLGVLDLLAEKSGWKGARARDEVWGLALHESFGSVVGQVAKLRRTAKGPKLEHVVCVVDCGLALNPNIVAMQMESGIGYGLSATLNGAITLKEGRVEQSNFDDYPVLRINEMPSIEVHIVPSRNKPSGVGEPGTPVIAPALVNALASMNDQPVRTLPLSRHAIQFG